MGEFKVIIYNKTKGTGMLLSKVLKINIKKDNRDFMAELLLETEKRSFNLEFYDIEIIKC